MVTTKPRILTYLIPLLGLVPVVAIVTGILVVTLGHRASAVPINLGQVQAAAEVRFGVNYDWGCQVQSVQGRTVICQSQPNGYYRAVYYVQPNGTLTLETYDPPPGV